VDDAEPQRKKKSLQVLKDSKRQRKQEKAVNPDGEADFCAQFYYYCKTDSEDEKTKFFTPTMQSQKAKARVIAV
jgi:hypothetical protein